MKRQINKTRKGGHVKDHNETRATGKGGFARLCLSFHRLLIAGAVVAGCRTASSEQQTEHSLRPFDAEKVARLSHESYKVAWDAQFWARRDLGIAPFHPTALDRETVYYLGQISRHVPWVARDIEKHRATPHASSRRSFDFVRYDVMMLKKRYQPTSFQNSTDLKIEKLLGLLDEITSYYDTK